LLCVEGVGNQIGWHFSVRLQFVFSVSLYLNVAFQQTINSYGHQKGVLPRH
jgi:hypothetical protein